ncbi:MAG: ATP-binding cassette domain-containing protein [Lachnospiraceae bacterium]|nr:ATP-binding cassette domain-containing protein [Lachnospiraceae bacterium]
MGIEFEIRKKYRDFSLDVSLKCDSKRIGILGASGCGKTMTLKSLAGLLKPDRGYISLDEKVLFDSKSGTDIRPGKRKIGYLFQDYALFPNMTVEENIKAALHGAAKDSGGYAKTPVENILDTFGLFDIRSHLPQELSGGQQQRTAIARMLACDPQLLLLDEPFSALDSFMREALRLELIGILDKFDKTVIMVSHDRDEIYQMCDYLLLMDRGRVIAHGPTDEIFSHPETPAAAKLTGCKNISRIERIDDHRFRALDWQGVELVTARKIEENIKYAGIRAHDFCAGNRGENVIPTGSTRISRLPFEWYVITENGLWWKIPKALNDDDMCDNVPQYISIDPEKILLMGQSTEEPNED